MLIYIVNLILIVMLYLILFRIHKNEKSKKIFCISIFIMFSLIQGFRSFNVGNDTQNYVKFFRLSENMPILDIIFMKQWSIEPGYGLLMKICNIINCTPQIFLLIVSMIINGLLMYFIYKYSDNPFMSVIIFMGVEFFTLSFTALRQMLAIVILLHSYPFIKQQKIKKFLLIVLLAATFHKTALVFAIVYIFKDIKINAKNICIGILIILLAQLILIPLIIFLTKKIFSELYITSNGSGVTQTLVIFTYFLIGILIYKNLLKEKEGIKNILFIIIYFALFIQTLAIRINMINRLMWYFYIFIIIYLPNMQKEIKGTIKIVKKELRLSTIYEITMISLSITQYIFFSMNMYNVVPYQILNI